MNGVFDLLGVARVHPFRTLIQILSSFSNHQNPNQDRVSSFFEYFKLPFWLKILCLTYFGEVEKFQRIPMEIID